MGALVGLLLGCGLILVVPGVRRPSARRGSRSAGRIAAELRAAGVEGVTPAGVVGACALVGVAAAFAMAVVSRTAVIAIVFGLMAACLPLALLRRRAAAATARIATAWPDVVDDLASAVRAGMGLPEALAAVGERGPEPLRPAFSRFSSDYRASGAFGACLDRLAAELADPVADRVIEALRMAREVGGHDLGRVLRTLSSFLRDDARLRGEVAARASWTVNGARLAVAAPWVVLAMLSLRPEAMAAYGTSAGAVVVVAVALTSAVAYRAMLALGRLPADPRVLT
jgi:tight adherence protein B